MPDLKLRFLARGTGMTPDYESQRAGVRRFHGYKHDPKLGPKYEVRDERGVPTGAIANHGAFVKQLGEVVEVPWHSPHKAEYLRHLRAGDLWAADEFTAQQAGVPFDPSFGGEHGDDWKAAQAAALAEERAIADKPLPQPAPAAKQGK
jgi:hypothetical protein